MADGDSSSPKIAIVGAGIMGASVAYYLAQKGKSATVYEESAVAAAASGKSGGFLAADWCSKPVDKLARLSFDLHRKLADELEADIEYRPVDAYSVSLGKDQSSGNAPDALKWINGDLRPSGRPSSIGTTKSCAQVMPKLLTKALLDAASSKVGTSVTMGRVTDITKSAEHSGKWYLRIIPTDNTKGGASEEFFDIVVLCMGPWTMKAREWFPSLSPIIAQKAASIIVSDVTVDPTILFTKYRDTHGQVREPEVYPREKEVYVCQTAVPDDLPESAADILVHSKDATDLANFTRMLNENLKENIDSGRSVAQACYLPISTDGVPLIGRVPDVENAFIATGHSCWGILNAPGSGKILADLIIDGKSKDFDEKPFDPSRFN